MPETSNGVPNEPQASPNASKSPESRTRIIRRAPTAPMPVIADQARTTQIPRRPTSWQDAPRAGRRGDLAGTGMDARATTAIAACAVSFVSGWATSVVATDLIAGWWKSDRLFCVAVGFLALVFALATVSGVILLLQRRALGRYLIVAGAVIALLTYGGVFIAGARVAWIVHTLPLLPIASVVLALHPQTKRYLVEE
ncbi:MAG: hypothetical protein JOZ23_16290 [Mycobacterium sp.]|nr:hypothetical protein [Mycobacterium sp.]